MTKLLKKLSFITLFIGISVLCGCGNSVPGEKSSFEISEPDGFSVSVKDAHSTGLVLEITNNQKSELTWGTRFSVEKETDGEWYLLETIQLPEEETFVWADERSVLAGNDTKTVELQWASLYGALPKGHYRIVKGDFSYPVPANQTEEDGTVYIACEFSIQ